MRIPKKSFQCRLPPDIFEAIDSHINAGRATSRSEVVFRALLLYFGHAAYITGATEHFRDMFYSPEFREYVKEIVRDENNRILDNNNHK